jgi:hypothetical protein
MAWVYTSRALTMEPAADCPSVRKMVEPAPSGPVAQVVLAVLEVGDLELDLPGGLLGFLLDYVQFGAQLLVGCYLFLELLGAASGCGAGSRRRRASLPA